MIMRSTKKHQNKFSNKFSNKFEIQIVHSSLWNKNSLNRILHNGRANRILVLGDVGIDRYTIGAVERISPEAPVPVVLVQEERLKLGLAANVADNLKALGAEPLLLGVIGKDQGAQVFKTLLKQGQIKSSSVIVDKDRKTALKERIVSDRQQIVRVDYESLNAVSDKIEKKVLKEFKSLLKTVDAVIMEDYAKGLLTPHMMSTIFKLALEADKIVVVDPNVKTAIEQYRGAAILTPNTREAEQLTGILIRDEKSLAHAGFALLKATGALYVIMTRGKDGMAIFARGDERILLIPTYAREVYDVSGAGDTVIAVLTLALTAGASIEEAAILGNIAAGIEVGKKGTATVSVDEIRKELDLAGSTVLQ